MKTVAFFSQDSLAFGGVESHLNTIASYSKAYTFLLIGNHTEQFATAMRSAGVNCISFDIRSQGSSSAYQQLRTILVETQVDLLHIHGHRGSLLGRLTARACHIPTVSTIHLSLLDHLRSGKNLFSKGKTLLAITADAVFNHLLPGQFIFVSEKSRDKMASLRLVPKSRCTVIPNGILLSDFQRQPKLRKPGQTPLIVFVGRLHDQKGVDVLLRSISEIQGAFHLYVIGDGPQEKSLKNFVARSGLSECVSFLGHRSDISSLLSQSDIFVLPSRYEAMPISLIEAAASGLPIIATDVGDNSRVVLDGFNGFLIEKENPGQLAERLQELISQPELRQVMGEHSLVIANKFDARTMVKSLQALYCSIIEK